MKCESCNTRQVEIERPKNEGLQGGLWDACTKEKPYRLCHECEGRLVNFALRPLEFFNLAAIHGHTNFLHDDFYDYDTGEAIQPKTEVIDAEKFPFPEFEEVKNDPSRLVDYSFVQYFTDDIVMERLREFDKAEVLGIIDKKLKYNDSIAYKAYEIIANAVGKTAKNWAEEQWKNRKTTDRVLDYAELISNCLEFNEAFELIKNELEKSDDDAFNFNVSALLYLRSEKTLDWLESSAKRIKSVTSAFGQLAASSRFGWQRCEKWLDSGRPLSLIALDALYLCTRQDYRGQSLWLRKIKPRLADNTAPEIIADKLRDYLKTDNVPRTKNIIGSIMYNLFEKA